MDDFVTSRVCACSPQDYWYHRIMVVVYYFAQIYNCGMLVLLSRTIFICICACTDSHLIPQMCGAGSGHSFSKGSLGNTVNITPTQRINIPMSQGQVCNSHVVQLAVVFTVLPMPADSTKINKPETKRGYHA